MEYSQEGCQLNDKQRLATAVQTPSSKDKITSPKRKMSLDANWKMPAPKVLLRVRSQHLEEASPAEADILFERKLNDSIEKKTLGMDIDDAVQAIVPLSFSSRTSRLNPENKFSSRLREDMRLSPIPLSPISNKRKRLEYTMDELPPDMKMQRPIKRLYRNSSSLRERSAPPAILNTNHIREASGNSDISDISSHTPNMSPFMESKFSYIAPGAMPLNLTMAGDEFMNMKLQ